MANIEAIAGVISTMLPSVVSLVQALFVKQNPGCHRPRRRKCCWR